MANKKAWATSDRKRQWKRILHVAQDDTCAGCGQKFGLKIRAPYSPLYPTLDHVQARAARGPNKIENLLLKHRRCNEARADAPPTGCDLLWQQVVIAKVEWSKMVLEIAETLPPLPYPDTHPIA